MTNRLKGACGGGFCARLLLLALVTAPMTGFPADSTAGAQKPEAGVAATKAVAESAPSLAEILTAMEALETGERKLRLLLADEERLRTLAAEIDEIEKAFSGIRRLADSVVNDLVGFHELVDLTGTLRAADQRLAAASDELASSASALDAGLDRIGAADAKTGTWMKTAEKRNAPPALVERIQGLAPRHEALARELRAHRDQVLETLGRATQLHGAVSALRIDVSERRDQLTAALRSERGEPIWRVESHPGEWDRIMQFFDVQAAPSFRHARDHASLLLAIAVTAFALTYWLIVATREPLAAEAEMESHARRIVNLFRVPALSSLAAALMVVIGFGPRGPINYHIMLWAFLLLLGVLLVRRVVGPHASLSLYTLAAALITQMLFGAFFDPLPLVSRLLLIAQCGALAVALGMDLGRGHFERLLPGLPAALVGWAARGIIILLAMAVLATVTGHLGAARVLRSLVLGGLGLWVLVSVVAAQLYGFSLALMHTGVGRSLRIVRLHRGAVRNSLRSAVIFVALVGWVLGMVLILGLGDEVSRLVDLLYHYELKIGSTSIDLTGVWVGLAVVLGTIVAVKIVGPLLELEILPRFMRKPGLPYAVSTVICYLLVTAGTLLAMAAMGIDLTKVTLLAGAVGVGIGFGLQGVVNNFVSGVILLMERPVNVGDVVQMGQLRGVVRRIGVRSSTILTGQGAEVIVPNADLISKEVTNWTLSDRRRCLEIDARVAYGTEPEEVVRLLEVTAREVAGVLANPPPSAAFTGFGDSSLNFRLAAWIGDYSEGSSIESALRMAVVRKFRDAGIEIPFPPFERLPPRSDLEKPGSGP